MKCKKLRKKERPNLNKKYWFSFCKIWEEKETLENMENRTNFSEESVLEL